MNEVNRDRVFKSLLGEDVSRFDDKTRATLEKIASDHLVAIEPVLDSVIADEIKLHNQPKVDENGNQIEAAKPQCAKCGKTFLPAYWPFNSLKYVYQVVSCFHCGTVVLAMVQAEIQSPIARPEPRPLLVKQ